MALPPVDVEVTAKPAGQQLAAWPTRLAYDSDAAIPANGAHHQYRRSGIGKKRPDVSLPFCVDKDSWGDLLQGAGEEFGTSLAARLLQ